MKPSLMVLASSFGCVFSAEFLQQWFESEHHLDEKLLSFVDELRARNILCYIATNQEHHRANYMRFQMGFDERFDGIFASADLGFRKPSLDFFNTLLRKIELKPAEVLFTDDAQQNVDAAEMLGITSHLYSNLDAFKKFAEEKC